MSVVTKMAGSAKAMLRGLKCIRHRYSLHDLKTGYEYHADCVILGTGPSLGGVLSGDRSSLAGKALFAMNDFVLSDAYAEVQPQFHLFLDPTYVDKEVVEEIERQRQAVFAALVEKTQWPLTLFVPWRARCSGMYEALVGRNSLLRLQYINVSSVQAFRPISFFLFRNNLGCPGIRNTMQVCIFLAINMGYQRVFLLGADHSWTQNIAVSDNNTLCIRSGYHFYDESDASMVPIIKDPVNGKAFKVHEFFSAMAETFAPYHLLNDYAKDQGCEVLNATPQSLIDAFRRISL